MFVPAWHNVSRMELINPLWLQARRVGALAKRKEEEKEMTAFSTYNQSLVITIKRVKPEGLYDRKESISLVASSVERERRDNSVCSLSFLFPLCRISIELRRATNCAPRSGKCQTTPGSSKIQKKRAK